MTALASPLGNLLRQQPFRLLVGSLLIGVLLALWSHFLGIGWATIEVTFITTTGVKVKREIAIGYVQQLNYGPWYLLPFFCPALYCLSALGLQLAERSLPAEWKGHCSPASLMDTWFGRIAEWTCLVLFVGVNVYVEFDQYRKLALGWVQIRQIQESISKHPPPLLLQDKAVHPVEAEAGKIAPTAQVQIDSFSPSGPPAASEWAVMAFTVLAKTWAGLWQAVVVYVGLLAALIEIRIIRRLSTPPPSHARSSLFDLSFLRAPAECLLVVGLLVNVFVILRFAANFYKGSFGVWDQYFTILLLLLLQLVIVILAFKTWTLVKLSDVSAEQGEFFTDTLRKWYWTWLVSYGFVLYLILTFASPPLDNLVRWLIGRWTGAGLK